MGLKVVRGLRTSFAGYVQAMCLVLASRQLHPWRGLPALPPLRTWRVAAEEAAQSGPGQGNPKGASCSFCPSPCGLHIALMGPASTNSCDLFRVLSRNVHENRSPRALLSKQLFRNSAASGSRFAAQSWKLLLVQIF